MIHFIAPQKPKNYNYSMQALSILTKALTIIFALSLVLLFSLIILVALPDSVLRAIGWISAISGIALLTSLIIKKRG